jgi:hypothetical protein
MGYKDKLSTFVEANKIKIKGFKPSFFSGICLILYFLSGIEENNYPNLDLSYAIIMTDIRRADIMWVWDDISAPTYPSKS